MENKNSSEGVGYAGALQIVFIALKLCGVISWSWLWVLSPLWITAALAVALLAIGLIVSCIVHLLED